MDVYHGLFRGIYVGWKEFIHEPVQNISVPLYKPAHW